MAKRRTALKPRVQNELADALALVKIGCRRIQRSTQYATDLYDAAEDVIYAATQMEKEASNA